MNDPLNNLMVELNGPVSEAPRPSASSTISSKEFCSSVEQNLEPNNRESKNLQQNVSGREAHVTFGTNNADKEPRPLWNPFTGKRPIRKHEKLEDRLVILSKAAGYTNIEIAEQLGISPVTVSYILKQPYAEAQVLEEIEGLGRDKVVAVLQGNAYECAKRIIEIAESAENEQVRLKANESVLNRILGMPTQRVDMHTTKHLEELSDAELAAIVSKGRSN